jgi:hypothetical protein
MITSLDSSKKISFLPFFTKDSKIKKIKLHSAITSTTGE